MTTQRPKQKLKRTWRIVCYLWYNLFYLFSGLVLAFLSVLGLGWLIRDGIGIKGWVGDTIMIVYVAILTIYILYKIIHWTVDNYKRHTKRADLNASPQAEVLPQQHNDQVAKGNDAKDPTRP